MRTPEPGRVKAAFRGRLGNFMLDAEFSVPATGVTAIFGASGCGKTTVARCIAGLQHMTDGFCAVDGDIWQDRQSFRPVHQRPIGYVFQEANLFPHLSVRGNLLFGAPKMAGARIGFDEVVELLGLSALLGRSPKRLSGGERQRVAIGRALLSQPKLLLMDEPLAALDRSTKNEILPFLERLHELASQNVEQRLMSALSRLSRDNSFLAKDGSLRLEVRHHRLLCEMVGATRESIALALGRLVGSGLAKRNGTSFLVAATALNGHINGDGLFNVATADRTEQWGPSP